MKRREALPEISNESLRDHGTEERVDRIWRRLENDLSTAPARPRAALWWAPAAVLIVFGSGVVVGARWGREPAPIAATTVQAEPRETAEEPAAGPELPVPVVPERAEERELRKERRTAPPPIPAQTSETPSTPELSPPLPAPTSAAPVSATPDWYRLAQELGDYKAARAAVERQGGFDAVLVQATADQLMALADIARATGSPGRAIQAWRRVIDHFPRDPNAPVAAYTLGQALEKAGDRAGAARAFEAYRSLSPKGDFAEDALARQVEVAIEQGNVELARQLADQYAKDFPNGRRLGEIRAQIAKLTGEPAAPGASTAQTVEEEAPSEEPDEETAPPAAPAPARPQ